MNISFYIARRYLVSKKSYNIINIISGISVTGITIGTMALIVVLSVFNGFESLIVSLFNSYNPDLVITASRGKTFTPDEISMEELKNIPGVLHLTEVVEDNALLKYESRQFIIKNLKGVGENYKQATRLDSALIDGSFILKGNGNSFAVLGAGVAYHLGIYLGDVIKPLVVYVPSRTRKIGGTFESAFNSKTIIPSGIVALNQEFDVQYTIVPIDFARDLYEYTNEVTSVEVDLIDEADVSDVQDRIKSLVGEEFKVKNRFQQQELLYKIMKSEKWAIFFILTFILIVATFNVIGSLTMLIIDKKKDIAVLHSMGANNRLIRRIFFIEGLLISLVGAVLGLFIGGVLGFLQQELGIIKLGSNTGDFIVSAYPVEMHFVDFIYVFITVVVIGSLSTLYPVMQISRKYLKQRLQ